MTARLKPFQKRQLRIRSRLKRHANQKDRMRLSIHRTNKHIYAQIIDDITGKTIVAASTNESALRAKLTSSSNASAAEEVGKESARRALEKGVKKVYFDRGSFLYHGRVAALAAGARAEGLEF